MKRNFVIWFFVSMLACSMLTVAYAENADQEKIGLNNEQTEQLKNQLSGLKQVFGIEQETQAPPAQSQQQQPAPKKNVADVADKALDMVNKMVADTAATLNKVAPDVWRIMMKQQYAFAITNLIAPWSCFFAALIFLAIMRKKWTAPIEGDEESGNAYWSRMWTTTIGPIVVIIFFTFWGISRMTDSVPMLINPEFYAIKNLILILLGK